MGSSSNGRLGSPGLRVKQPPGGVWWLEQAMAVEPEPWAAPLQGPLQTDVCIVGGGYTGLWTAIEIREQAPDTEVALIERGYCGTGASGRNGGWATGWYDELDSFVRRFGDTEALRLAERSHWALDRIESFCEEHRIECHWRRRGAMWTASAPGQVGSWDDAVSACRRLGRGEMLEPLPVEELQRRAGTTVLRGGVRHSDAASVQPALLVRGLRRAALALGVRIFEATPLLEWRDGEPAELVTPTGRIECSRVVLALGAWSSRVRELRRAIVPIGSHIVLTEPLDADRLSSLPWANGELLGDSRLMVHYAQVTKEGRVAFGRGGGAIGPRGRVVAAHFDNPVATAAIVDDLHHWFPQLHGVRIERSWGGPVDRAPGHLPFTGRIGEHGNVLYGAGFSGNGVAPSALIGRMLGRQALGVRDEDTQSPLAGGPPGLLPPEPLRSVGGALLRGAVDRFERAEQRGRTAPHVRGALGRLVASTVPRPLDPRLRRIHRAATNGAGAHDFTPNARQAHQVHLGVRDDQ